MPQYSPSTDETIVNQPTSDSRSDAHVTALTGGGYVVTWYAQDGDPSEGAIYARLYDGQGHELTPEFRVNTHYNGPQTEPDITALAGGGFVITWTDFWPLTPTPDDDSGTAVRGQMFSAAGAKVGGEFLVNTQTTGDQSGSAVSSLAGGGFVVTWVDGSGDPDPDTVGVKAQIYSAAGAKVGGEIIVPELARGDQVLPDVVGLPGGGFVAVWADNGHKSGDPSEFGIFARIFDASGAPTTGEFVVNTAAYLYQFAPQVSALAGGGFVVTWYDESGVDDGHGIDVKAQVFDGSGARVGTEILVNTPQDGEQNWPSVTGLPDGGFLIAWTDNTGVAGDNDFDGVVAQQFDAAGGKVGGVFEINQNTAGEERQPALITLASGDVVAVWEDNSAHDNAFEIKTRLLSPQHPAFQAVGAAAVANSVTAGVQGAPQITGLAGGGYVVTWQSDATGSGGDGSGAAVKAQVFDASGAKAGAEFVVEKHTAGDQVAPQVTALADGNFVVALNDHHGFGGGGTAFQIFTAAGAKVGDELLVNGSGSGLSEVTDVAALHGGGFLVVGNDVDETASDADAQGVKAQLFDSVGNAIGGQITVNADASGQQNDGHAAGLAGGGFVVVWRDSQHDDDEHVVGQLFDAAGNPVGAAFAVGTTPDELANQPEVTALAGGGFVVAWDATSNLDFSTQIKAQVYDASGAAVGSELVVSGTGEAPQGPPTLTATADGGFVVAWDHGADIVAQAYDASGAALSGEFVAGHNGGGVTGAAATGLDNGGLAVAWESGGDIGVQLFGSTSAEAGTGDQTFTGTPGPDVFYGYAGNDTFLASGGVNAYHGGYGADVFKAGPTYEEFHGGAGIDTADYATFQNGITVDLHSTDSQHITGVKWDLLEGVENVRGSKGADTLVGDDGVNTLKGEGGNDHLDGAGGDDFLLGDGGDDVLNGGTGFDTLAGGAGHDTFVFTSLDSDLIKDWQSGEVVDVTALHAHGLQLTVSGGKTYARFDLDGDGQYDDGTIVVQSTAITASDFHI